MSKEIQLRRITRWTLWFAAIWVVLNLPFGFLELYGRTKGVFNYPTTSVGESEREGVLLKDMRDSVDFEGAIEGAAFDEAWIEKNRKLEFVVSLVPFLWSLDFWSYPGGQSFIVKDMSLGTFYLHGGASLKMIANSRTQLLEGGFHCGRTNISSYRIPDPMAWEGARAVFYRAY